MQIYHRRSVPLIIVVFQVAFLLFPGISFAKEDNDIDTKCSFFDSVNVTGYPSFPNGSYSYEGTLIPSHYVETYDYIYLDLVNRVDVTPHIRGCICKLKPCVNICCPKGFVFSNGECGQDTNTDLWPEPMVNVTLNDGSIQNMNMHEQFVVQSFIPCTSMYFLKPEIDSSDAYQIFKNGTILIEYDQQHMNKNEFCLAASFVNDTELHTIYPALCFEETKRPMIEIITSYAMFFSIPFMLLTIVVYLLIPDLRNEHGKSLICYLSGLTIGYTILVCQYHIDLIEHPDLTCKMLGYVTYFFFMSAFIWLNVISFDLWQSFRRTRGVNRFQKKKQFLFYSLYSWGLALVFLVFTVLVQEFSSWPEEVKPGIGGEKFCFLDMTNWSPMIYFYGPILVIIMANTIMFVVTAFKIHSVQKEMDKIISKESSAKNLRTEKDNFGLFLRLFLIMGVTWSTEIVSYFVNKDSKWQIIFYVSDLCNALQGFLIFILFVLKKNVRRLISKRLFSMSRMLKNRTSKTNTQSSKAVAKTFRGQ